MPNLSIDRAADVLKAVAHPSRIRIVLALTQQASINVSSLQQQLQLEQSLLSQHLTKLKDKKILISQRQGSEIYYSLADPTVVDVLQLMLILTESKRKHRV
ncbi:metalloregulator ArsR/SmtB family transcription factor [Spirosoma sp. KNUC1025]|uniref:metalloregulator ArsR/SmtB family transcription factor n=1 Tax=Spirosoma sp. KNUC1025 TaxID=2894082 RepID=UPI00386A883A|nr:metalloregulator ArsR/SmtB family transcription factor [Spirosoma sp. KNUC1025]